MSTVSSFRPPEGGQPVVAIHTTPALMKKLVAFLKHFDRPPQQVYLEFVFLEVAEDDLAEFRYNVQHPLLYRLLGRAPPVNAPMAGSDAAAAPPPSL
uniref:General secretion pathway protein DN2 n=1 Tax=Malawimonas jakobiformis TaxID=136089 RepID=A0A895KRS6_MALJA|nr:general secretion pathway protein DN2 [Malawimonas jakobiformis]